MYALSVALFAFQHFFAPNEGSFVFDQSRSDICAGAPQMQQEADGIGRAVGEEASFNTVNVWPVMFANPV